jgi:hypothetical protein
LRFAGTTASFLGVHCQVHIACPLALSTRHSLCSA